MNAPRFLIIDTSGRIGQVALAEGPRLLMSRMLDANRKHARDLTPAVRDLLGAAAWKPREVEGLIVNRGPGSYTGLRVGIVAAKVFAHVTGCALLGVDCFSAVARQAPAGVQELDVLADAQRELIYVQRFQRKNLDFTPRSPLEIQAFANWKMAWQSPVWATGPGLTRFIGVLEAKERVVDAALWDPIPQSLLQIGLARFEMGERDDPLTLEPIYLRPSSAEEKADQRSVGKK